MSKGSASFKLPEPWRRLCGQVETDGYLLSEAVYDQALALFLEQFRNVDLSPEHITSEFQHVEFLQVVDEEGRAQVATERMLNSYQTALKENPGFSKWFSLAERPSEDSSLILLAARWLCHLVGLRHGTVEIFIDPPHLDGHTLVQIRGLEKFEAPGAFDIPCAGHISGTDTVEKSLEKELAEELDLTLHDLDEIRRVKQYNSYTGGGKNIFANHEFRVLYRARLKSSAAAKIRFRDGEVAGLAVFSVPELRGISSRYPERIASGLSDALIFYQ